MSETKKSEFQRLVKETLEIWGRKENLFFALSLAGMATMVFGLHKSGIYNGGALFLRQAAKEYGIDV